MNFYEAIVSCFRNYATFSGRAPRSEFWFFSLFSVIALVLMMTIDAKVLAQRGWSPLSLAVGVTLLLPFLAVSVRRLHDVDRNGLWLLVSICSNGLIHIVLLVWYCTEGTAGENRYGPDPLTNCHVAPSSSLVLGLR